VTGAGRLLSLGLFGEVTFSVNGDLGNLFYLSRDFLSGVSNTPRDQSIFTIVNPDAAFTTFTSAELACGVLRSETDPLIQCFVPNSWDVPFIRFPWTDAGAVPRPAFTSCDDLTSSTASTSVNSQSMCFAVAGSAWQSALAVTGITRNRTRFVATYFVQDAASRSPTMLCSSGCSDDRDLISSSDLTFGDQIALYGRVLVVGAPGDNAKKGAAFVYCAVGTPNDSNYGAHRRWEAVGRLQEDDPNPYAAGRFGAGLSLGPSLLAVAAPGNTRFSWRGTVTVFSYRLSGKSSLDIQPICKVGRSNMVEDSAFGLAMAQSEASGGRTVVAVGSPDENAVYLLWISANGACEVKKEPVDSSLHIRGVCTKHMTSFFRVDRTQSGLFILILLFQAQIEMVPPRSSTYGQFGASVAFARNFLFVGQPGCKT
jgi:hypothetical protein